MNKIADYTLILSVIWKLLWSPHSGVNGTNSFSFLIEVSVEMLQCCFAFCPHHLHSAVLKYYILLISKQKTLVTCCNTFLVIFLHSVWFRAQLYIFCASPPQANIHPIMWMLLFRQSTSKLLPRMSVTMSSDGRVVFRYSARVSDASGCCQQWGRLAVCSRTRPASQCAGGKWPLCSPSQKPVAKGHNSASL